MEFIQSRFRVKPGMTQPVFSAFAVFHFILQSIIFKLQGIQDPLQRDNPKPMQIKYSISSRK